MRFRLMITALCMLLVTGCASMTPADVMLLGEKTNFAFSLPPAEVHTRIVAGANECFGSFMKIESSYQTDTKVGQVAAMIAAGSTYSAMFVAWLSSDREGTGTALTVARHASAKNMPAVIKAWVDGNAKFCRI